MAQGREAWNAVRFREGAQGHYESWFQRANHPSEPLAFWIRYTIFHPADSGRAALGELWFVLFGRADGSVVARKAELPLADCRFDRAGLDVHIGTSTLDATRCEGNIDEVRWALKFDSPRPPMLMLPEGLYARGFPKAKLVTGSPLARFRGHIDIGDRRINIDDWVGSQNHNWGSRHTDRYAWGQVAGFDDAPDVFFEAATAWLDIGPLTTPPLTIASVRIGDTTVQRVGMLQAARSDGALDGFHWQLTTAGRGVRIHATFDAEPADFVALRYLNPPGGHKACLNSKLARCTLEVEAPGLPRRRLHTQHRAAFEILQDEPPPGLNLRF
ncbi:MAG: hypothetical protein AAGA54_22345 [Myxococcota bacterium]